MENPQLCVDKVIPVTFRIDRNGRTTISTQEYVELITNAKSYTVGSGKNATDFDIVHTTVGYVSVYTKGTKAVAVWIADPFIIKAVVADEKKDHYAEVETANGTIRLPFEAFLPNKIDAALFNKGIAVSKVNKVHEALSMHLQWLLGQFEVQDAKMTIGWRHKDKELLWCGTSNDPPLLKYKLTLPSEEEYISKLNNYINGSPALQFVVCAAASSTLLAYLNITEKVPTDSFGVSLVGTSSTGKTTALQLAASLYSSPDDESVYSGFYGTNNALIHMLGRHQGVPLCYDESTIDNHMNKANFVYAFAEGKSKLRLDQQSQLKERDTWLCTCLFSSETHLVDISNNDNLGLGVRIINLENYTYTKNSLHSEEIKTFAGTNYGIVGEMISDYLLNADSANVREEYFAVKKVLQSLKAINKCSLTDRLIQNYAIIICTAGILCDIGITVDVKAIRDICVKAHNKIAESANPGKNIIRQVFNCISSKYKNFKGIKWTTSKDGKPVKVAIIETTFADILTECGISDIKGAVNNLDKEGYLIRQSNNRLKSKLSIDGVPCYAYQFDISKVNEAFGQIDDDTFSNVKKYSWTDKGTDEVLNIVNDEEAIIHEGNYKVINNKKAVGGTAFLL